MKFTQLKLDHRLLKGIHDRGFRDMTPVQEQTLAQSLDGRDVTVQSQTGTGKTAAFLITLYHHLLKNRTSHKHMALIIVPTRELAAQIEKEAVLLNRHLNLSIGSFYGGVGYGTQLARLQKGLDVIIGTPGRLLDLSQKDNLKLKKAGILIIDEADRLLDMGFLPDIRRIIQQLPPRQHRLNMMFSATLNHVSRQIAQTHMNDPVNIEINPEQLTVETVSQELYHVYSHIKLNLMLGLLKNRSPQNALIFTNMKYRAAKLSKKLRYNGFPCRHMTGDIPQRQRAKIMEDFKAGRFPLLVATDVAARGLQIDNLEMVINYDLPQDCESYVHRIGRTARAGNSGEAISLACEGTASHLKAIESFIGMKIPVKEADGLFARDKSQEMESRGRPPGKRSHQKRSSGRSH